MLMTIIKEVQHHRLTCCWNRDRASTAPHRWLQTLTDGAPRSHWLSLHWICSSDLLFPFFNNISWQPSFTFLMRLQWAHWGVLCVDTTLVHRWFIILFMFEWFKGQSYEAKLTQWSGTWTRLEKQSVSKITLLENYCSSLAAYEQSIKNETFAQHRDIRPSTAPLCVRHKQQHCQWK